jgi:hypothetical protein
MPILCNCNSGRMQENESVAQACDYSVDDALELPEHVWRLLVTRESRVNDGFSNLPIREGLGQVSKR